MRCSRMTLFVFSPATLTASSKHTCCLSFFTPTHRLGTPQSLFSVGATGTLVFGLASKDIASQVMAGLSLHLSEKMFEGDEVKFSDGTSGKISKMGWFETMVREDLLCIKENCIKCILFLYDITLFFFFQHSKQHFFQ
jgi:hypothetical protein